MKHMNPKLATLLYEGFSMSTLEKMSNDQLNLLYSKIVNEDSTPVPPNQVKKITGTEVTVPPGGNATAPAGSKVQNKNGKTVITTTETELGEEENEIKEKSVSKKQQEFFGIVRGMQKGDIPKKGKAGKAAKEMKKKDVKDFASTKHKNLPNKKTETKESDDVKKLEESIMRLVEKHISNQFTKTDILKMINKR